MIRLIPLLAVLFLASCASTSSIDEIDRDRALMFVDHVLNTWHTDASTGNFDRYFDAMTRDSIFLGTDATERWTKDQFMGYAREPFSDGNGWTYTPSERFVAFSDHGHTAWVDELLTNAKYGTLRGTAVLQRRGDDWKIAHYSLTFLVPNEKAGSVVEVIAEE